jgi:hypothetical protein
MSRWRAAGIHLAISIGIAVLVVLLLLFLWYPAPYFDAMGGKFLLMLLIGVDVVLGPLITLIIFNTKKKSLKFDLAVIALVQLAALCYGMYTMYAARPVYVVYAHGAFLVVPANDIEPELLAKVSRPEIKKLSWTGPRFVFNNPPASSEDMVTFMVAMEGFAPEFYLPYEEKASMVANDGKLVSDLLTKKPQFRSAIEEALKQLNIAAENVKYFPMVAKTGKMTVLAHSKSGNILTVLPIDPFD